MTPIIGPTTAFRNRSVSRSASARDLLPGRVGAIRRSTARSSRGASWTTSSVSKVATRRVRICRLWSWVNSRSVRGRSFLPLPGPRRLMKGCGTLQSCGQRRVLMPTRNRRA